MADTFEFISKYTVASNQTSVSFTSIPQTYSELVLIGSGRSDVSGQGDGWNLQMNGNGINSSFRMYAYNDGSTASYGSDTSNNSILTSGNAWTSGAYGAFWYVIPNYSLNGNAKVAIGHTMWGGPNTTTGRGFLCDFAGGYTSAVTNSTITSLTIASPDSGGTNMMAGSVFWLYGILKA